MADQGFAASFSPDYTAARARFRASALALEAHLEAWSIDQRGPDGEELTIDMARLGGPRPRRAVVISSGIHGVEGFFGSAVQSALLEEVLGGFLPPPDTTIIFLHALNPFGFAWQRRVNEDNADLNRNMLRPDERYAGAPDGYGELDAFLNPQSPPPLVEGFLLRAGLLIARHGMPALKNAIAGGQYEYPKGLFFGGHSPSRTARVLDERLPALVGQCERVLHIDLHTGLGPWATYKLFVDHPWGSEQATALGATFGEDVVEPWEPEKGTSYAISGGLGTWCKARFPEVDYDVLAAEFGTHKSVSVLRALREENRCWHWARRDDVVSMRARKRLTDVFAPPDPRWRHECVEQAIGVVERAIDAISEAS